MTPGSIYRRRTVSLASLSVLLFVLLLPTLALAAGPGDYLLSLLHSFVVGVFGMFTGWAGTLLDFAINDMVVGFGEAYRDGGLGYVIDNNWVIVRDIFNLTFIFGLVFIGLRMIFDSANSNTRKMLIYLVMAALLVNFSLFITKFVVDFSNIAAVQLVNAFGGESITSAIVDEIGLSSLYKTDDKLIEVMFSGMSSAAGLGYIFATMVILIITTFVFMAGAFLLMIRFAVLNIYMLLSPLMFIGWVFPGAAGITKQYWSGFLGRAFFAPAYILMLYFSFQIIQGYGKITTFDNGSYTKLFAENTTASIEAILPPFFLTAVFLIASIVVAQKLGANGADGVISLGRSLTGKARKAAFSSAAYAAGRAPRALANRTGARTLKSFNKFQAKAQANAQTNPSRTNKLVAAVSTQNWLDQGVRAVGKGLKEAELGTGTTNEKEAIYKSKTQAAAANRADIMQAAELFTLRDKLKAGPINAIDDARLKQLEPMEAKLLSSVTSLGTSDFEDMPSDQLNTIAPNLTNSQVENIMKSDKIGAQSKAAVAKARYDAIEKVVGKTGAVITKELTKLTIDQIETMGDQWVRDNVHLFSKTQMDDLKKSKKFSENQRNNFADIRKTTHEAAAKGTPVNGVVPNIADLFYNSDRSPRKAEDIANLGPKVLLEPNVLDHLTPDVLEMIGEKKTLNQVDRESLANMINTFPSNNKTALTNYLKSTQGQRNWNVII